MSWRVANACAERKFGSAARKQIIMFLADKASDDGSGIWCSKGTIQRHTELGESTVKRTIREFLKEGILVETGARGCKNGFTVVYRIDLAKVEALELTAEPDIETGATVDPVQTGPGTGATVTGVPGPQRPPNHPKTIQKPPTRERVVAEDEEAEKVLAAYPPDRVRGKAESLRRIREALDAGTEVEELLQAVKAYATESAGFTRSKVCFSDNWFKSQKWRNQIDQISRSRMAGKEKEASALDMAANWIIDHHPLSRHVTPHQIDALLAAGRVSGEQLRSAGLRQ
ncbi:hypothetical protein EU803_08205 [Loktanella sp. IMCC34160]|uniref:hypothetical protein n=1 Tax=Loktanella sp. IMCC34160 TaxID=2510646 RepID=UPI00101DC1A1|nr:hypothetical protein [Loktanella sp. IMCC34160]RYG91075.1 hypothetical protein EU803_08205 [Loktanella sp. IMCC34160]